MNFVANSWLLVAGGARLQALNRSQTINSFWLFRRYALATFDQPDRIYRLGKLKSLGDWNLDQTLPAFTASMKAETSRFTSGAKK